MIILYIGPYNRPDFATDFLLSPILAPDSLLARFPKVFLLTGERDPLVDDTVIFAGRLRQAHFQRFQERKELGLIPEKERFDEGKVVEVMLIPGISHGFLQFVSVFPEGWKYILQCSRWMREVFREADERERDAMSTAADGEDYFANFQNGQGHQHHRTHSRASAPEASDAEDRPLEMSSASSLKTATSRRTSSSTPTA